MDDGNSAVSLPEVPLLGVLPGTGGLTRVVDKRKVRRDLADVFATLAEGIKGKRAVEWRLVDGSFRAAVSRKPSASAPWRWLRKTGADDGRRPGARRAIARAIRDSVRYRHVELQLNREARTAIDSDRSERPQHGPAHNPQGGADYWPLRAFRELDDALLRLRFHHDEIGLVLLKTRGDLEAVRAVDEALLDRLAATGWYTKSCC